MSVSESERVTDFRYKALHELVGLAHGGRRAGTSGGCPIEAA